MKPTRRQFLDRSLKTSAALATASSLHAANDPDAIRLIVRADDIGTNHAANLACIRSFEEGIVRTVELMVPTPWFPEAVAMLKQQPDELDIGLHLVLTSEWDAMKWRPLTNGRSFCDEDGHFLAMGWPKERLGALREADLDLAEVETELRAQIDTALRHLPRISHFTTHMGFTDGDPGIPGLVDELAREYGKTTAPAIGTAKRVNGWNRDDDTPARLETFLTRLGELEPGLHMLVVHPGLDVPEMQALGHPGYRDVAANLASETALMTHPQVLEAIERHGIQLLSYQDLA